MKSKGFFAWLFGGGDDEEDTAAAQQQASGGRRGQRRMASVDPNVSGSIPASDVGVGMSSRDGGARAFMLEAPAAVSPTVATHSQRRPAPVQQAALERPLAVERPDTHAQQMLAQAMEGQERDRQQDGATKTDALAVGTAVPSFEPLPTAKPASVAVTAEADPTTAPTIPMPPRRPVELASPGPTTPLPPGRPPQFAGAVPGPKGGGQAGPTVQRDAIAALLGTVPSRTAGLPAAILHGNKGAKPPAQLMAFAAPVAPIASSSSSLPTRVAVPIPTARPNFVAARLDPSRFPPLIGNEDTRRVPARTGMGSAVGALRSAAKTSLGALSSQPSPGAIIGFGTRATDLATDHFSGPALKSREHVVTSSAGAPPTTRAD